MKSLETPAQLKLKNILYATDLSFAAERALPYALEIARRHGASLYAVHAIQPDVYPLVPPPAWPDLAQQEELFRQESRRDLEERLEAVPHEITFRPGKIWEILSEVIREKRIDLLVTSTHGRTGFDKVFFGSVAEEIFRKAKCPVLTVGPGVSSKPRQNAQMHRILYATDFSPESLAGAPYAVSMAREHGARLLLLHCLENGGDVPTMRRTLLDLVPFGTDLKWEPDCVVERGKPAEKILELAEGYGVDLIVLGLRGADGHTARITHFARTAAYKIVTLAKCPVLTVRG